MHKIMIAPITLGLLISCLACLEIRPLTPGSDPSQQLGSSDACIPSPIEKNIIGTWHFESTYNPNQAVTKGTVVFKADGTVVDQDSLFESHLYGQVVTSKTYSPTENSPFPNYTGKLFEVYQTYKSGKQVIYFTLVSNECNRIHLSLFLSDKNQSGFILTR